MRVLHFSDIHVGISLRDVPLMKWLSKRAIGGAHLAIGRGEYFADAPRKTEALARFAREQNVELTIFTGDYTALGLDLEFDLARSVVASLMRSPAGYLNVSGNHDLYVPQVVRARRFEHYFGEALASDISDSGVDGPWPVVRLVGDDVAVVAVESSRPNLPWRSSGRVPDRQLAALSELLADARLRDRFIFVATHYAPRLADGGPDRRLHRMVNAEEFLKVCADIGRGAILCGHVHHRYRVQIPGISPPIFCAGSATMARREGAWIFDVDKNGAKATPVRWDKTRYVTEPPVAVHDSSAS